MNSCVDDREFPGLRWAIPHSGMTEREKAVARLLIEHCRESQRWTGCPLDLLIAKAKYQGQRRAIAASSRGERNHLRRQRLAGRPPVPANLETEIREIVEHLASPKGMNRLDVTETCGRLVVFPKKDLMEPAG